MKVAMKFPIIELHSHRVMGILINSPDESSKVET